MQGEIKDIEAIETVISLIGWSGGVSNPAVHTAYASDIGDIPGAGRYDISVYQGEEWETNVSVEELPESVQKAIIWDEEAKDDID